MTIYGKGAGHYLQQIFVLGPWYSTHQQWESMGNSRYVVLRNGERYWRHNHELTTMSSTETVVEEQIYSISIVSRGNPN